MSKKTAADIGNLLITASDELMEVFVLARKTDGKIVSEDSGVTVGQIRQMLDEFNDEVSKSGRALIKKAPKQKFVM